MEFSTIEKIAIAKALDEIIQADGEIKQGEMSYLRQLFEVVGFDMAHIVTARETDPHEAIQVLRSMTNEKKALLALMMHEMAEADGEIDLEELKVIGTIFSAAGLNLKAGGAKSENFDLSDVYFVSHDHIRYENGRHVAGPHGGARRAVKIEDDIQGRNGYTVTIFNLVGNHPFWGNNVMMAPKPMKVISEDNEKIVLRGYGEDPKAMGHPDGSFANYGCTLHLDHNSIEKIELHMHDRNVDIVYLKED